MRHLLILIVPLLLACGGSSGPSDAEAAPFREAFSRYTSEKNYGVTLDTFEALEIDGDSATATIRVAAKEATKLRPRWKVEFSKTDDGWKATSHKAQ